MFSVLENGPWLWQSNSFYTNYSGFYQFCDAIENVVAGAAITPDANGVGLEKALAGYANYVNTTIIPGCKFTIILKMKILMVTSNRLPRLWLYR
jgi:hypothetical protein